MTEYDYTKTPVDILSLASQIKGSSITSVYSYMNWDEASSAIAIFFQSDLSDADKATLDGVVSAHAGIAVPQEVTPRQIRLALFSHGVTTTMIDSAIASLSDPTKTEAQIAWEYSLTFERYNPLVAVLGQMLGWTSQQLDNLWILAVTL
jgi:hypothetical protein